MPFGPKGLVVTWSGPVPQDAEVTYASPEIFSEVDHVMGSETPDDFPKKYLDKLKRVDLFNAQISENSNELVQWEKRHNVEMQREPLSIFENYLSSNYVIASTLVEHPQVSEPEKYKDACSVVLQRGVIVSDPDPRVRDFVFAVLLPQR